MKLSGNTILITGAGTGIGRSLAMQLHKLGNEVIICGRRESKLKEVQEACPGIHIKRCDINSDADRQEMLEFVKSEFPSLNVIINNGAVQTDYDLKEGIDGLKYAQEEVAINLTAPVLLNGYFIPFLLGQKEPVIVNMTSVLGLTPLAQIPMYCAAKAGFHVYTLALRKQLENTPIKVFDVPPPRVDETELNPEGRKKMKYLPGYKPLYADEYAAFVIEELEKDNLDVYYPNFADLIKTKPRYETELSRLR